MKPMIPKRTRRLRARAATMNSHESEYEDYGPEPNMKLSHAFLVVLLLHVIAVGGIYAFNSFKASKAPKLAETAKALSPQDQPAQPLFNSGGGDENPSDPENRPPSNDKEEKVPVVTKTAEAPAVNQQAAPEIKPTLSKTTPKAHQGLFASIKSALHKITGGGVAAATTASVATAAAQDAPTPAPLTTGTASQPVVETKASTSSPDTAAPTTPTPKTYLVKAGDTLTKIAASLGVTIPNLEKANSMTGSTVLRIGQTLQVPEKIVAQAASDAASQTSQVAGSVGQIPGAIASGANTLSSEVQGAVAPTTASPSTNGMTEYTVAKGDNPYKIAKKFKITPSDLMKVNNITDPKKIQIGQKLKIPASHKTTKVAK